MNFTPEQIGIATAKMDSATYKEFESLKAQLVTAQKGFAKAMYDPSNKSVVRVATTTLENARFDYNEIVARYL